MESGRTVGGIEVAVAIVFVLVAPGVLPVVEDLTAEDVTTDAPGMGPSAFMQHALADPDGVGIDDLVGAVAVEGAKPWPRAREW